MSDPSFNLWTSPWITVENADGGLTTVSIETVLVNAHEFLAIYDPSPLVVVGIHRLLTAILQDKLAPQHERDLAKLWESGQFPRELIHEFGNEYGHRFDLFSLEEPFLQSADLPLQWTKGEKPEPKSVATLFPEMPSGTMVTHYQHGSEDEFILCPSCITKGLLMIPPFVTSGGPGLKPSINGVPPIYVLPGGTTLFESIVASLLLPTYQPEVRDIQNDSVWWKRKAFVNEKNESTQVGYTHSLLYPARRIRLHPQQTKNNCSKCGQLCEIGIRTMIFRMGESRPKDAPFWFDPFAAYRLPDAESKSAKAQTPTPIRPVEGRVLWREFAGLFLQNDRANTRQPSALKQIADLIDQYQVADDETPYPFRCVGMRTDMKAKIFEWIDVGFGVPPHLLQDPAGGVVVQAAIDFAISCDGTLRRVFRQHFGGDGKEERRKQAKQEMSATFWRNLSGPFRGYIVQIVDPNTRDQVSKEWIDLVVTQGIDTFRQATATLGDSAATLQQRVQGESHCRASLHKLRNDWKGV
ncbi:MAG: type I-E CRISPR-associated protein Cse1/CasA [Caldilineaceae bacterium]